MLLGIFFFFSSRRRHTRCSRDWSSDVCSSDLDPSTARWWIVASAAGFAKMAPASPTMAAPAPPMPAARAEPGSTASRVPADWAVRRTGGRVVSKARSEEHTSELQSRLHLVCRLLLEKKKKKNAK